MSISNENVRRAGPYQGDGVQAAFPFAFKVFDADQLQVITSIDGVVESPLAPSEYQVELEEDQDSTEGGIIYLNSPLPVGQFLTILSDVPYTQPLNLTSRGGFYPDAINLAFDRCVILIQQLKELSSRQLSVPATSEKTPQQVITEILDIAAEANRFAEQAKETYQAVLATKALVEQTRVHVDQQKALVDASEAEVEEDRLEVEQMLGEAKEVNEVTVQFLPHVNELIEIGESIEDVRAVASELQGFPIESMDLGFVTDKATPVYDTKQSNLAFLAANIDKIQLAIDNLDEIQAAAEAALRAEAAAASAEANAVIAEESAERVVEIEKTNFEKIYEEGVS